MWEQRIITKREASTPQDLSIAVKMNLQCEDILVGGNVDYKKLY